MAKRHTPAQKIAPSVRHFEMQKNGPSKRRKMSASFSFVLGIPRLQPSFAEKVNEDCPDAAVASRSRAFAKRDV
jgi:hypothetical protein